MNLLGSAAYDPAAAVSKSTASLLALTALDTTNLRLAITVPAHGKVLFRLAGTITGATTVPTILLGVLNGSTVLKRQAPQIFTGTNNAATQDVTAKAEFVVTGLTPGALNADAAYAVQVVVAATNIKYGGPNDTTGNDAWGAFVFEAWDPQPLKAALDGGVNVTQLLGTAWLTPAVAGTPDVNAKQLGGTAQTGRDVGASVLLSTGTGAGQLDFTSGVVKANLAQILGTAITETAGQIAAAFKKFFDIASPTSTMNLITAVTTLTTYTGNTPQTGDNFARIGAAGAGLTALGDARIANLDAAVTTRLATAGYTAPLTAATTRSAVGLASANLDTQLSGIDTKAAAVQTQTDKMVFTVANQVDVNIKSVKGIAVATGTGTGADPWGP